MSSTSPSSVLYSSDGYELSVVNGSVIPSGTRGLLMEGSDGTDSRFIVVDASGNQVVVGSTAAGSGASTGLVTIQGNVSGTPVPVSGTVTANAGTGNFTVVQATAANLNATVIGTTAAGSGASAGLVTIQGNAGGTPVPISGTVTATNNSVGTDGAAALGFDTQVGGKVTTAAPTYTTGNLNALSLTTLGGLRIDGVYIVGSTNATAADVTNVGGYVTTAAPTYTTGQLNPFSLDTSGNLRVTGFVTTNKATTSSVTSVASSATNTTLLASNASRIFASIYNDSSKTVFIKLGTTASATSFTILLMPNSYWEVPNDYTGEIDAIWSAANGNARVTELTP